MHVPRIGQSNDALLHRIWQQILDRHAWTSKATVARTHHAVADAVTGADRWQKQNRIGVQVPAVVESVNRSANSGSPIRARWALQPLRAWLSYI